MVFHLSSNDPLTGAKIIGGLFCLAGILLIIMAIANYITLPTIPGLEQLAGYLGSVGVIMQFVYGILALALGVGLIKEEEWAAGGSFVLLVILIVELGSYVWYFVSTFGYANLPITVWIAATVVFLSIIIMIYLIWASGWR